MTVDVYLTLREVSDLVEPFGRPAFLHTIHTHYPQAVSHLPGDGTPFANLLTSAIGSMGRNGHIPNSQFNRYDRAGVQQLIAHLEASKEALQEQVPVTRSEMQHMRRELLASLQGLEDKLDHVTNMVARLS